MARCNHCCSSRLLTPALCADCYQADVEVRHTTRRVADEAQRVADNPPRGLRNLKVLLGERQAAQATWDARLDLEEVPS